MLECEVKDKLTHIFDYLCENTKPNGPSIKVAQVATIGVDGNPKLRNIVIRSVSRVLNEITFYTDIRSSKTAEIRLNPKISLAHYNTERNLQIRIEGTAKIHNEGALTKAAWVSTRNSSLILYRNPLAPGTSISHPSEAHRHEHSVEAVDANQGYENFCVAVISVLTIDCLDLSKEGHERIFFYRKGSGWNGGWIAP